MTMMRKFMIGLMIVSLFLSGCQLAQEEQGSQKRDQLVGIYITTESIYHEIHNDGNPAADEDRLYASKVDGTRSEFLFPLEGYFFYTAEVITEQEHYVTSATSPGISNPHVAYKTTDDGEERELEATVYFLSGTDLVLYANPVYQTATGDLYLTQNSGMGISHGGGAITLKENVQTDLEGEESYAISVTLNYQDMDQIESVTLIAMNDENQILEQNTYAPDEVPKEILPSDQTAYYLVQTRTIDSEGEIITLREVYGKDQKWIETYVLNDEGIYIGQSTQICWE